MHKIFQIKISYFLLTFDKFTTVYRMHSHMQHRCLQSETQYKLVDKLIITPLSINYGYQTVVSQKCELIAT